MWCSWRIEDALALSRWEVLLGKIELESLTDGDREDHSAPCQTLSVVVPCLGTCSPVLTQCECKEKRRGATIHQTSPNLNIEGSSDGTTDTDELDVSTLELAVCIIVDYSNGANRIAASRLECLLFVDANTLRLLIAGAILGEVIDAAGGHC